MSETQNQSDVVEFALEGGRSFFGRKSGGDVVARCGTRAVARFEMSVVPGRNRFFDHPNGFLVGVSLLDDAFPGLPRRLDFLVDAELRGGSENNTWVCRKITLKTAEANLAVRTLVCAFEDANRTDGEGALWLCAEDSSVAIYSFTGEELVSFQPVWRDSDVARRVVARFQVLISATHPLRTAATIFGLALQPMLTGVDQYRPLTIEEFRALA